MRTTTRIALAAAFGLGAHASAQSFTNDSIVSVPVSWRESTSTGATVPNPDGVLEPGEFALIWLEVSFTNQGGPATFSPPIGTYSSGTITGFGYGFFDLNGSGGTVGMFNTSTPVANHNGTSGFGVRGDWRAGGNWGPNPASDGLIDIFFGQAPANPTLVNTANPITNMVRFLWTPSSFDPRTIRFDLAPAAVSLGNAAAVHIDSDATTGFGISVPVSNINFGSVSIPIVPAPPTLLVAAAALAGLTSRRPRRRNHP